jgi:hypothetical protein
MHGELMKKVFLVILMAFFCITSVAATELPEPQEPYPYLEDGDTLSAEWLMSYFNVIYEWARRTEAGLVTSTADIASLTSDIASLTSDIASLTLRVEELETTVSGLRPIGDLIASQTPFIVTEDHIWCHLRLETPDASNTVTIPEIDTPVMSSLEIRHIGSGTLQFNATGTATLQYSDGLTLETYTGGTVSLLKVQDDPDIWEIVGELQESAE